MLLALFLLAAVPATGEAGVPSSANTDSEPVAELTVPPAPEVLLTGWGEAVERLRTRSVELRTALAQLELAGAGWPWRPTALLALTATAAIAIALVPAAATRRSRR